MVSLEHDLFALSTSWVPDIRRQIGTGCGDGRHQGLSVGIITARSCSHISGVRGGEVLAAHSDTRHSPAVLYSTDSGFSLDAPAIMLTQKMLVTSPKMPFPVGELARSRSCPRRCLMLLDVSPTRNTGILAPSN